MEMMKPSIDVVPKHHQYIQQKANNNRNSSTHTLDQLDEHLYHRRWYVFKKGLHQTGGVAPMLALILSYLSYLTNTNLVDIDVDVLKLISENIPTRRFRRFVYKKMMFIQSILEYVTNRVYRIVIQYYDYASYQLVMMTTGNTCINYNPDDDVLFELYNLWVSMILIIISISIINKLIKKLSYFMDLLFVNSTAR